MLIIPPNKEEGEMGSSTSPFMASLPQAFCFTDVVSRYLNYSIPPTTFTISTASILRCSTPNISIHRRGFLPSATPRPDDSQLQSEQQVDLSVLRFTLGIPGLDESYLPRYLGIGFGSLIVLNHLLTSSPPTSAQLTSELLGISLATFSVALPYIGKFLKGARPVDRSFHTEENKQIFVMSENLPNNIVEDLAWASFVLLRNTNTMAVLISFQDALCVRGYWNAPVADSKVVILDWFKRQIREIGLPELRDALYFPEISDRLWAILPSGTTSVLLQPALENIDRIYYEEDNKNTFILLVSSSAYAYRDRDRAWIKVVANKFQRNSLILQV